MVSQRIKTSRYQQNQLGSNRLRKISSPKLQSRTTLSSPYVPWIVSSLPSNQLVQFTQRFAYHTHALVHHTILSFRGRHTLTLIHFLQYVHLTVCLIMGSLEKSSYALAIAYKARPTPRKLTTLLRNALFLYFSVPSFPQ
jgi:hypothetical protein